MRIKEILKGKKPSFSLEIFPPKPDYPLDTIYETLDGLQGLNPDFISVTYGAGGSNKGRTVEIASAVKNKYKIESLAHLTCMNHSKKDIKEIALSLQEADISNVLALRGDPPKEASEKKGDFLFAKELIEFLSECGDYSIGAAAYPEGHPETPDPELELDYLVEKIESGVDYLITQMVFDNHYIYEFLEKLARRNVKVPVLVGILPVFHFGQIKRISALSGATIPQVLIDLLADKSHSPKETELIGIEYAVRQINELVENGIDGIHLYTMNKVGQAKEIFKQIGR